MIRRLEVSTSGQGLWEFTESLQQCVADAALEDGLCTLFVQHTSASLLVQENADPSAQQDLENWLSRLVPEDDALFTHTLEGPDDMPAHVKASVLGSSLTIPILSGNLVLGTWQGIYLFEHRNQGSSRHLVLTVFGSLDGS